MIKNISNNKNILRLTDIEYSFSERKENRDNYYNTYYYYEFEAVLKPFTFTIPEGKKFLVSNILNYFLIGWSIYRSLDKEIRYNGSNTARIYFNKYNIISWNNKNYIINDYNDKDATKNKILLEAWTYTVAYSSKRIVEIPGKTSDSNSSRVDNYKRTFENNFRTEMPGILSQYSLLFEILWEELNEND